MKMPAKAKPPEPKTSSKHATSQLRRRAPRRKLRTQPKAKSKSQSLIPTLSTPATGVEIANMIKSRNPDLGVTRGMMSRFQQQLNQTDRENKTFVTEALQVAAKQKNAIAETRELQEAARRQAALIADAEKDIAAKQIAVDHLEKITKEAEAKRKEALALHKPLGMIKYYDEMINTFQNKIDKAKTEEKKILLQRERDKLMNERDEAAAAETIAAGETDMIIDTMQHQREAHSNKTVSEMYRAELQNNAELYKQAEEKQKLELENDYLKKKMAREMSAEQLAKMKEINDQKAAAQKQRDIEKMKITSASPKSLTLGEELQRKQALLVMNKEKAEAEKMQNDHEIQQEIAKQKEKERDLEARMAVAKDQKDKALSDEAWSALQNKARATLANILREQVVEKQNETISDLSKHAELEGLTNLNDKYIRELYGAAPKEGN